MPRHYHAEAMHDALAGQAGLLKQALYQGSIGMALLELNGSILDVNAAFCTLLQHDAAGLKPLQATIGRVAVSSLSRWPPVCGSSVNQGTAS